MLLHSLLDKYLWKKDGISNPSVIGQIVPLLCFNDDDFVIKLLMNIDMLKEIKETSNSANMKDERMKKSPTDRKSPRLVSRRDGIRH